MNLYKYATHEVININRVTRSTVHILHKLHFMLLPYITEEIWRLYCKYSLSCPLPMLSYRHKIDTFICQNISIYNIYFTHYCHIWARNKYECHIANICHIFNISDIHISACMSIYVPHMKSLASPCDQECFYTDNIRTMVTSFNCTSHMWPRAKSAKKKINS